MVNICLWILHYFIKFTEACVVNFETLCIDELMKMIYFVTGVLISVWYSPFSPKKQNSQV